MLTTRHSPPVHYYDLLATEPSCPTPMDAIIVPAARPAHNLLGAAALATKTQTPLIILNSKDATTDDIAAAFADKPLLQWSAVEIPSGYEDPLLQFSAAECIPEPAKSHPASDLSLKRNLGLLIGRQFGHRIFFMDDDIKIAPSQLEYAGRLLSKYALAGFRSTDFPDKSVIGHIEKTRQPTRTFHNADRPYREDVFISGNALAVNLDKVSDHFPDIYNEDWLFMFNGLSRGDAISAGEARQEPYDYLRESRAAREEFGETIADGLYDACDNGQISQITRTRYWDRVIQQRRSRISALRDGRRRRADLVLRSALAVSRCITPDICVEYVGTWQSDQLVWKDRLGMLQDSPSLKSSLQTLNLPVHVGNIS